MTSIIPNYSKVQKFLERLPNVHGLSLRTHLFYSLPLKDFMTLYHKINHLHPQSRTVQVLDLDPEIRAIVNKAQFFDPTITLKFILLLCQYRIYHDHEINEDRILGFKIVMCRYNSKGCTNPNCTWRHDSDRVSSPICQYYPNCKFGDKCLKVHLKSFELHDIIMEIIPHRIKSYQELIDIKPITDTIIKIG